MTANPISNDDDYTTPDITENDNSLHEFGTDYNNDGVVDNDIVSDDSVNNDIVTNDESGLPPNGSVLVEDEFDRIITEDTEDA
jgi:hypothetical protein